MRNALFFLFLVLAAWPSAALCEGEGDEGILRITPLLSSGTVRPGQPLSFELKLKVEKGWHINSDKPNSKYLIPSKLELSKKRDIYLQSVDYPEPVEYDLDFAEKPVSVFEGSFSITGEIQAGSDSKSGISELLFRFEYQACSQNTCLRPQTAQVPIEVKVKDPGFSSGQKAFADKNSGGEVSYTEESLSGNEFLSRIESAGLLLGLVLVFFGGLALNLTPCVYPIIPITISYFGAQSEGRTGRLFFLGVLYVTGMAVTYSVIGVITAMTGAFFGSLLQHPVVLISISAFFVLMALSMFGLFEFRLPRRFVDAAGGARSGFFGALVMGLTMGIIAAPCIGPLVLGLVAFVAAKGEPVHGFFLFFFLALGLGTPYLFLALFSGKIKRLPSAGEWMEGIRHIFGLLLLGAAVYFAVPLLPEPAGQFALPVFGFASAGFLLLFEKNAKSVPGFRILKLVLCLILIGVSGYLIIPEGKERTDLQEFSQELYTQSLEENRKMVIIFSADWCIPCRKLEKQTFSDQRVVEKFREFRVFEVDMTHADDAGSKRIRDRFDIKGVPTVVLIDSSGSLASRITGMTDAETFISELSKIK